uniref:MULE domain-containing protein n=1 Tax=Strongyloides papillosus TaxID=174720 RepID=A0A0N5BSY9_STREA
MDNFETETEEIGNCFDLSSISSKDNGTIITNLASKRLNKSLIFIKSNPSSNILKETRGYSYVADKNNLNSNTESSYYCRSCRTLYDRWAYKNKKRGLPTTKIISHVYLDKEMKLFKKTKHHPECTGEITVSQLIIEQLLIKYYKIAELRMVNCFDVHLQFINEASEIAYINNNSPFDITTEISFPTYRQFAGSVKYHKKRRGFEDIKNRPELLLTLDRREFVRYISNEMIVMMSPQGEQILRNCDYMASDGTFCKSSSEHYQLYSFQCRNPQSTKFFPSCFVLLNGKRESLYKQMFEVIKSLVCTSCDWSKKILFLDKELAACKAAKEVLKCTVKLCVFHTISCFQRALKKGGLQNFYTIKKKYKLRNQDSTTHATLYSNIQKIYCLPYFPPEEAILYWRRYIKPGFLKVTGSIGKKIKEFVTYMDTRWFMSYSGYSPSMMSIYSLDVTTTNSCEGFHSKLKRCLIMTKKGKVVDVIEGLKMMELRISSEYLREGLYGGEGEKSIKNKAFYQLYCCFQFNEKNLDEYAAEIT